MATTDAINIGKEGRPGVRCHRRGGGLHVDDDGRLMNAAKARAVRHCSS